MSAQPELGYSLDEEVYYKAEYFTEELRELVDNMETDDGKIVQDGEIIQGIHIGESFHPDIADLVNGADIAERMAESPDEIWEINTEDCHWCEELHGSDRVHRMIEQAVVQAIRAAIGTPTCWGVKNVRKAKIRITSVAEMEWEVLEEANHE